MWPWRCRVCTMVIVVALGPQTRAGARQAPSPEREADALYARREDPASARRAAEILADAVRRNPQDFGAAWKLARVRDWLGDHAPKADRPEQYERGMEAARLAIAARSDRPEGHFWLGSNMGKLADLGMMAGLKYSRRVREEFETVEKLAPGFDGGSALTALGDWYLRVPGFMGGDKTKAEEFLRKALTYDAGNTASHYLLAETLLAMNRKPEARVELQRVIDASVDPDWLPEGREWKQKARELLQKLGPSKEPRQAAAR